MEITKTGKKNNLLKSLEAIKHENLKLQHCLKEIILARKSAEKHLDLVEKQLSSLAEEENQFQAINAKHGVKIQTVEEEANRLEEKQKILTEDIKILEQKIKECKEDSDIKINKYTRDAENMCELFLSAIHNETAESENLKILDEIAKLHAVIADKENDIADIKKELEDFVFYGISEEPIESTVPLEERQLLLSCMEDQFLDARHCLEDINILKSKKQMEEMEWGQKFSVPI